MQPNRPRFLQRVHNLFFSLSFTYQVPLTYRILLWIVEKCLLLCPLILPIFANTPWAYLNDIVVGFNLLNYFPSSGGGFSVLCIVLFVVVQCILALLAYSLIQPQNVAACRTLALCFPMVRSVLVQLTTLIFFYLMTVLVIGTALVFSDYKGISPAMVTPMGAMHLALCALYGVQLLEVLALDSMDILLAQEERLSVTCTRPWKFKLLDLVSRAAIMATFVCDATDDHVLWTASALALIFLAKIVSWFLVPATTRDMPEYAYDFIAFLFILFNGLFTQLQTHDYYQYSLLLPAYVAMASGIRMMVHSGGAQGELKTEEDVVVYLRTISGLFLDAESSSMLGLYGHLEKHRAGCTHVDCGCHSITLNELMSDWGDTTKLNYKTYETGKDAPERLIKSCKRRVLGILMGDIRPGLTKSPIVGLGMAEMYYYFLGNHYESLVFVQSAEVSNPSMVVRQRTSNLRNVIETGMSKGTEEAVSLMAALQFQTEYYSFLSCIEYSCECTVKFWQLLKEDLPDPAVLSRLGQEIFETSQRLFSLVKSINRASPDHIEFLFKFGLYAKRILHDKVSSSYAFQRLLWNTENSSLRSRKDQLMTLVVSLEQHNFFNILDVNVELEHQLGYRREELIGFPSTKLMHSRIAKQHHELARRYFKTMKSTMFGTERLHFFRHQDGYVVTCRATKRLVPNLTEGLRGVMLIYPDLAASSYTAQRTDRSRRRTGALLCDDKGRVTEYTKDAEEIGLHKEVLLAGTTIQTIFPELRDEQIFQFASRPQGTVLLFNSSNGNEESIQDDAGDLRSQGEGNVQVQRSILLMWIRVVTEKCGDETQIVLLFSPLPKVAQREYRSIDEFGGKVYERVDQIVHLRVSNGPGVGMPKSASHEVSFAGVGDIDMSSELGSQSQSGSTSGAGSFASVNTQSTATDGQDSLLHDEMQAGDRTDETPTIIKRLAIVLGVFLTVIISLIVVETTNFSSETKDLSERFQLIEYFTMRYEILLYLLPCPMNYDLSRRGTDNSALTGYCGRASARANRIGIYNTLLQKAFSRFGMMYDYEMVTLTVQNDTFQVAFNYALPNYVNMELTYLSLNNLTISKYCAGNYTAPICRVNSLALDYCNANGMPTILPMQTRVSMTLINDLLRIATQGRDSLYVLIGSCIAVVVLSSVLILVLLIWVIKGKSRVMSIFAEVQASEIEIILAQARSLNITTARFDVKYVTMCEGNEEKFWRYFIKKTHTHTRAHGLNSQAVLVADEKAIEAKVAEPSPEKEAAVAPNGNTPVEEEKEGKKEKGKSEQDDDDNSIEPDKDVESEKLRIELEQRSKLEGKRVLLGQIDSSMRNWSMLKLGAVLLFFLVYGGVSLYFNYYVHSFNSEATQFFYVLMKRDTYPQIVSTCLRQSLMYKNKALLLYSNTSGTMYMMDYVSELQRGDARIAEYNSYVANKRIFAHYLKVCAEMDSPLFCTYADNVNVGQTGVCNVTYGGPKDMGLTTGLQYCLSYFVSYSARILAADFSNNTLVNSMITSTEISFSGVKVWIFLQSVIEQQLSAYREDVVSFYDLVLIILITKAVCFAVLFAALYIIVFVILLNTLKREIWLTKGMIGLIPKFVLENNLSVQKLVYNNRRAAVN